MTETEFEKAYAKNSGLTIKRLHELGQFAVPCDCEEEICEGWVMVSRNTVKDHVKLYIKEV
jgi:hypothetical protein